MVLSKRWKYLYTFVPTLEYDHNSYPDGEDRSFSRFVYSSLLLHEAPVLQVLSFLLGQNTGAIDIGVCVRIAIKRHARLLNIEIDDTCSAETINPVILPTSLYTGCTMLVSLGLTNVVLMDSSSTVSFPSLKILGLQSVKYPNNESVPKILSGCPIIESLFVERCLGDNVSLFVVRVASLKILSVINLSDNHADGILIDAPSLEIMRILENTEVFCGIEHNMPKIETANVCVTCNRTEKILSSLTSLQQLRLCVMTSKDAYDAAYPEGILFNRLVDLTLCIFEPECLNLLMPLLKDSPKLRFLKLEQVHPPEAMNRRPCWNEPTDVPSCLLSSLEAFEWSQYEGREEEIKVAQFIIRNSACLKNATFYPKSTDPTEKLEMLMELSVSPRSSSICQLDFGRGTPTCGKGTAVLQDAYSVGTVFHRLCHKIATPRPCWNDPSSVPECLSASLETLEWVRYQGSKEENEVATFILRSGRCLKKVTISSTSTDSDKKLEMLKELSLSFRRSPTCQLAFN
ncbi:probable FBD-associated F-box protein At1g32375 [Brassica rapa]|uniref:probable FBD-associated F-box protein At1g32375 n=1 Tax=Brassica campestris TaxID=3711 RepID=UPI00142E1859|nr:probable FBD-associated F-box protein At1g32375 [Brassica rapa]XP_048621011.1 probable FBD-associated F-box protein At1g32375 [Brassica napus]